MQLPCRREARLEVSPQSPDAVFSAFGNACLFDAQSLAEQVVGIVANVRHFADKECSWCTATLK